jgi:ABC-type dipeptide/oligopeptide/nickel transport system permease subunit
LREAQGLAEKGVKEITLLGQNVNAYHGQGEGGDWGLARLVRAQAMVLKREPFIEAAQTMGMSWSAIAWRHTIPNLAGVLGVSLLLTLPRAILAESTLSFIGLGVAPPMASLGSLASDGWQLVRVAPHLLIESAVLLTLLMALCRGLIRRQPRYAA